MSTGEALCCCEYENQAGEKSHILACCCDCQALDEMADRCFKCQKIPTSLVDKFIDNLLDRLRIPGITGRGAARVNLEVATPIIVIPLALCCATIGPITTCVVLSILPYFCFYFYRTWKRRNKKSRTKFFFVWGVMSVIYMYIVFEYLLCRYSSVGIVDNIVISLSVIIMFISLYHAKKDPGMILNLQGLKTFGLDTANSEQEYSQIYDLNQQSNTSGSVAPKYSNETVIQVDNHVNKQLRQGYCDKCKIEKPSRAGHCTVCGVCIHHRDHHCVWIDSCIGEANHRAFLAAITAFVFAGYYGSYVTIVTVCDPSPNNAICDLRVAYRDFKFALCFVSACYVALVTTIMAVGLVHQIILISQNVTSQELHRATILGKTKCLLVATNNPYNRGFIRNWILFLRKNRRMLASKKREVLRT